MKCPKCNGMFTKVYFEDFEVDRCVSCSGIWFDTLELSDLLKKKGSSKIDTGDKRDFQKTSALEDIKCPRHNSKLIKMVDPRQPHIWYESCGDCQGVFLDATEFKDLQESKISDFIRSILVSERKA